MKTLIHHHTCGLSLFYSFFFLHYAAMSQQSRTCLKMTEETTTEKYGSKPVERGVSVDQDGKSNVWAIEPKVELSMKSSEEQTQSALIAGGGIAAMAVAAGLILTNLPDPSQF